MESQELVATPEVKTKSFISHVFNFDNSTKEELINIIQYTVIAIIPVILLNKGVGKLIPEVDETKSTFIMTSEVLGQSLLMFFGMFLIHRLITYFPTYSGKDYASFSVTNIIILFMIITLSFQTRIGEKTNILIDRAFDLVEGRTTVVSKEVEKQKPANPQHVRQPMQTQHQHTTHINDLPQMQHNVNTQPHVNNTPDFNSMYSGPNNPMENAHQPSMMEGMTSEPMAANDFGSGLNAY
jgi:hypothetical protein